MNTKFKLTLAVLAGVALGVMAIQGLNAQTKPLAYLVSEIEVTNPAVYQTYVDRNTPIVAAAGGRFITRGEKIVALDGPAPAFRQHRIRQHGTSAGLSCFGGLQGTHPDPRKVVQISCVPRRGLSEHGRGEITCPSPMPLRSGHTDFATSRPVGTAIEIQAPGITAPRSFTEAREFLRYLVTDPKNRLQSFRPAWLARSSQARYDATTVKSLNLPECCP